jgi:hypothetical protein
VTSPADSPAVACYCRRSTSISTVCGGSIDDGFKERNDMEIPGINISSMSLAGVEKTV